MIDTSKISAVDVRMLGSTTLDAVRRFYDDPENQRQFDEWLKNREKNGGK
jgi:hypothetical protein